MSGIERDKARVKATGEVFTPTLLVQEILDTFDQSVFVDSTKTFLDPTCGDGQFLGEVLIRKIEKLEHWIKTTFAPQVFKLDRPKKALTKFSK
jgi:hypothetical protein